MADWYTGSQAGDEELRQEAYAEARAEERARKAEEEAVKLPYRSQPRTPLDLPISEIKAMGKPPIQRKHRSFPNIAGQLARDAGKPMDGRNDLYLPGTPERDAYNDGWKERDQLLSPKAPGAYDLAEPVAGMIPTGVPAYDYEVKSWPQFFEPMVSGKKLHDMRDKRDRDYKVGDRVLLREYDPFGGGYTGRVAIAHITYITSNDTPCAMSSVGLGRDMAILSVKVSGPYPDDDRWA